MLGLLLVLHLRIIPSGLRDGLWDVTDQTLLAMYKAKTVPDVLLFHPTMIFFRPKGHSAQEKGQNLAPGPIPVQLFIEQTSFFKLEILLGQNSLDLT